ncbi:MAG: MobA/MobL family protein [Lachnospiraceae bacterium]|nr:MobA/MobL family protein [Lachnospiraceae bacterium]
MARHSFIRMYKLPDVCGRVDYISNPSRQEHLYATYSTVKPEFWKYLADQAQFDFWRSNQPDGKCIEARELIIALPESFQRIEPETLLKIFAEKFRIEYGMQCTAALHHNKTKTNYHIHLIFADREPLREKEVKIASRNMFYNEEGRHVRTKKEILDAEGNIRPGCRILPKGSPYEVRYFSARKDEFKSNVFLPEAKMMYTDLINELVTDELDRQEVFDPAGPYLPTKKIGKNNPLENEIKADNALRQEWNHTVDQVLIAGGTQEEVADFKREEVVKKVAASVKEHGEQPGLFAAVIRRVIAVLKEFLEILMRTDEKTLEEPAGGSVPAFPNAEKNGKGPRPDSTEAEVRFKKILPVHEKLRQCNRRLYALQEQQETLQKAIDTLPRTVFHHKERKELQTGLEELRKPISQCRSQLERIPKQNGFGSVKAVESAYWSARNELEKIRREQAEWDGVAVPQMPVRPQKSQVSVLKKLAEKRLETVENQKRERGSEREMKGENNL